MQKEWIEGGLSSVPIKRYLSVSNGTHAHCIGSIYSGRDKVAVDRRFDRLCSLCGAKRRAALCKRAIIFDHFTQLNRAKSVTEIVLLPLVIIDEGKIAKFGV